MARGVATRTTCRAGGRACARVESVDGERWTKVLGTERGQARCAPTSTLVDSEPARRRRWTQELEGRPFERMFREVTTEVVARARGRRHRVTLALHQRLRGINRLGGFLLRRASRACSTRRSTAWSASWPLTGPPATTARGAR